MKVGNYKKKMEFLRLSNGLRFFLSISLISLFIFAGQLGCQKKDESKEDEYLPDKIAGKQPIGIPAGEIVFVSQIRGKYQIFKMKTDGSKAQNLSQNRINDENPRWSPDGKWIAFDSNRDGDRNVYIMRANGSEQKRITTDRATDMQPCWMPDGKHLIFESNRSGRGDLYIIDLETLTPKVLFTKNKAGSNGGADVSPGGRKVAYMSNRFIGWDIFLGYTNGDAGQSLATEGGNCKAIWSPDGNQIAWVHHSRFNPVTDIWLMKADGSDKRNLTDNNPYWAFYPSWSPDGKWIAFASGAKKFSSDWEIYIIEMATGKMNRLTANRHLDYQPDWSAF